MIPDNLEHTRLTDEAAVHCMPVDQIYRRLKGPYDFVILDPPYADPGIEVHMRQLAASSLLQSDALVVLGHWPRLRLPEEM